MNGGVEGLTYPVCQLGKRAGLTGVGMCCVVRGESFWRAYCAAVGATPEASQGMG